MRMKNVSNGAESVPVATGLELKNDAPEEAGSGLERVNVCLSPAVLDWLDTAGSAMYRGTGWRASRSALLRAIIGAFSAAKVTFTGCHNEAQVKHVVSKLFQVAQSQRANQSTQRPAANTAPAPRDHQSQGAARQPQASGRVDAGSKPVPAAVPLPVDQDDEVQDVATAAGFDAFMKANGYAPRSPRATVDRAKVEAMKAFDDYMRSRGGGGGR
jgi:hypothetical protein